MNGEEDERVRQRCLLERQVVGPDHDGPGFGEELRVLLIEAWRVLALVPSSTVQTTHMNVSLKRARPEQEGVPVAARDIVRLSACPSPREPKSRTPDHVRPPTSGDPRDMTSAVECANRKSPRRRR